MKLVDSRKKRDFKTDIGRIKRLHVKNVIEYYLDFLNSTNIVTLVVCVVAFALSAWLRDVCDLNPGNRALSIAYFANYILLFVYIAAIIFSLIECGYRPYIYTKVRFDRLRMAMIQSNDYEQLGIYMKKVNDDFLRGCSASTARWITDLKVYCEEESFVSDYSECQIKSIRKNQEKSLIRVSGKDQFDSAFAAIIPYAGTVFEGDDDQLVLTNKGAVIRRKVC